LDATDIGDDINYAKELKQENGETYFEIGIGSSAGVGVYSALYQLVSPHLKAIGGYLSYPFRVVAHRSGAASVETSSIAYDYYKFHLSVNGVVERNRFFIFRHPLESTRQYFEQTLGNISRLAAKVKADGAEFLLVVAPRFQHWNPGECPNNWEKGEYALAEPYQFEYLRFFDEAANRVSFRVLNLLPAFRASKDFPLVFEDDPHWNERGHRVVGMRLAEYIISEQIIPTVWKTR
ncbi:MAG TPA: hypothetical protein VNL69_08520, partial [Bacteroidota bacterium]|nr:hypothetical protein [Bacteroidota bacterium]